jgi:hypothetical protein
MGILLIPGEAHAAGIEEEPRVFPLCFDNLISESVSPLTGDPSPVVPGLDKKRGHVGMAKKQQEKSSQAKAASASASEKI